MTIKKLAGALAGCALVLSACADNGDSSATTASSETTVSAETSEESSGETSDDTSADATGESTVQTGTSNTTETIDASSDEESDDTTDGTSDETTGTLAGSSDDTSEQTSDGGADGTSDEATTPAGTTPKPNETEGFSTPQAIISLSPTATEMLYAIGAGEQVLAVDDFSNYPVEAADKMQGLSGFEPNVEAIAGLEPDLVVTDGTNPDLLAQLDTLGIPHWEGPAVVTLDEVYAQIEQLGATVGRGAEAADLVGGMRMDLAAIKVELPDLDEPLTYYHELDDTYFSATSGTFIGAVYSEVGLVNIADDAGVDSTFPQLSAEYIIDQNPDLIFLACTIYCGITAQSVGERPGWQNLDAVAGGGVIEMNDDIASRWGPRIVDYLRIVGRAVNGVAPPAVVG